MKKLISVSFLTIFFFLFVVNLNASNFQNLLKQGINQYKEENYEEAIEIFKKAYKIEPNSTALNYFIGLTFRSMENYKESIPYFRKAVTLSPKIKEALPELINSLYHVGQFQEALKWIEVGKNEKIYLNRIYFLEGLILFRMNKLDNAITSFKKALELDPTLKQNVDFQLAAIYLRKNYIKKAKNKLNAVIQTNPQSDLASFAKEYLALIEKREKSQKSFSIAASAYFKYDSNVILKPEESIPGINITEKSDTGLLTNASISYTAPFSFTTPYSLNLNYYISVDNYFTIHTHDVTFHSFEIVPGHTYNKFFISMPMSYSYVWVHEKNYLEQFTLSPKVRYLIKKNNFIELCFSFAKKNYRYKPASKQSDRDANQYSFYTRYMYIFKNGKGFFTSKLEIQRDVTKGDYWRRTNKIWSNYLIYPILPRLDFQIGFTLEIQHFDNSQPAIGKTIGTYDHRTDKIYSPIFEIRYRINKNFSIVANYKYTRDDSSIPVYDYQRHVTMAGLEFRW